MKRVKAPQPRGMIQSGSPFTHERWLPRAELQDYIQHFWCVSWTLPAGQVHTQRNIPHPTVHLVIDPQQGSAMVGVQKRVFRYELAGEGRVLGAKFWPGAFAAFARPPLATLNDMHCEISPYFDLSSDLLERALLNKGFESTIDELENLILAQIKPLPQKARQARNMVGLIERHIDILSVETLSKRSGLGLRSLQRLFRDYIGVSPKWVIERYRLIEANEKLKNGESANLTELAHSLGYFDQAHFYRAWLRLLGQPPSSFEKV
jgi:AraC-like DNA-binding protein